MVNGAILPTVCVGRLATYKYYNMDQVAAQALTLFARLMEQRTEPAELAKSA